MLTYGLANVHLYAQFFSANKCPLPSRWHIGKKSGEGKLKRKGIAFLEGSRLELLKYLPEKDIVT
jgi:hypothetical protein